MSNLSSPLIWLGAKSWLVPRLQELSNNRHGSMRVVEPFMGSLTVSLGMRPLSAMLRDANPHLVNFWRWVRRGLKISIRMENDEKLYYEHRDAFNGLIEAGCGNEAEMAMLFYYLNRTSFNGVTRFNKKGLYNVPFGRRKTINYRTEFSEYASALEHWQIEDGDFESTKLLPDDFVYLDPPYDCEFTEYNGATFSWEQQVRVAEKFAAHEGPVVASNAATARIINLYRRCGYDVDFVAAPRSVSADASKRGAVLEILATKNLT